MVKMKNIFRYLADDSYTQKELVVIELPPKRGKGAVMRDIGGTQRKYLRGLAHSLKPVIQIGKSGITEALISSVNQALDDHELIKVKFLEFKNEKKSLAQSIELTSDCQLVGMIGHIAIFYREHPDEEKKKIKLP